MAVNRATASTPAQEGAVLDHQAAILHDLNACARESFGGSVVAYAGLEPDRARALGEYVFERRRDVLRASEDINHVNLAGDVREFPIDLQAEDMRRFRVIDRHGHDLKPRRDEVLRDVEGGLVALRLGLHAEHGDALRRGEQLADGPVNLDEIFAPIALSLSPAVSHLFLRPHSLPPPSSAERDARDAERGMPSLRRIMFAHSIARRSTSQSACRGFLFGA